VLQMSAAVCRVEQRQGVSHVDEARCASLLLKAVATACPYKSGPLLVPQVMPLAAPAHHALGPAEDPPDLAAGAKSQQNLALQRVQLLGRPSHLVCYLTDCVHRSPKLHLCFVVSADLGWQAADLAIADDVLPSSSAADSNGAQPAARPESAGGRSGVPAAVLLPPRLPEPLVRLVLHTLLANWEVKAILLDSDILHKGQGVSVQAALATGSRGLPTCAGALDALPSNVQVAAALYCLLVLEAVWAV
jgi:hypothetical protein